MLPMLPTLLAAAATDAAAAAAPTADAAPAADAASRYGVDRCWKARTSASPGAFSVWGIVRDTHAEPAAANWTTLLSELRFGMRFERGVMGLVAGALLMACGGKVGEEAGERASGGTATGGVDRGDSGGIPTAEGGAGSAGATSAGGSSPITGSGGGLGGIPAKCVPGKTWCNGVCVDLQLDPLNCGLCGLACLPDDTCSGGVCTPPCAGGTVCGGSCVDLETDVRNCGACGNACPVDHTCVRGFCSCRPGLTDCGGECVDTLVDLGHCGGCGVTCPGIETCSAGACLCVGGAICAGTCVQTAIDPNNCGGCGIGCDDGVCVNGECVSAAP